MKRSTQKFGYCWMMWFLCAHSSFAQTKPETAPPPVAADASPVSSLSTLPSPLHKLEVDTIAAIPLEERRALLAKLSAEERVKFARPSKERFSKALATEWLRRKPTEARPWIQSSKMPEAQKKQLLGSD